MKVPRLVSNITTVVTLVLTALLALAGGLAWLIVDAVRSKGGVSIVLHAAEGGTKDAPIVTQGFTNDATYASWYQAIASNPVAPRTALLQQLAVGGPFVVFLLGCVVLAVVTLRLRSSTTFGRGTRWLVGGFGVLCGIVAVAKPWLIAEAELAAVVEMGLPTTPSGNTWWFVPWPFDFANIDFVLLLLGVIMAFITALLRRAERLQDDTAGLV